MATGEVIITGEAIITGEVIITSEMMATGQAEVRSVQTMLDGRIVALLLSYVSCLRVGSLQGHLANNGRGHTPV